MATTGPATSSMAFKRRLAGGQALLDVVLDGLHHDDGVVDHEADGEHEAEQGEGIDGEAEQGKDRERAHQGHWHGQEGDEGGPQALQKDEDDDDDERRAPRTGS